MFIRKAKDLIGAGIEDKIAMWTFLPKDSFDKNVERAGENCADFNENCGRWAALGECTKNPEYMVGTKGLVGYCRRSCKLCWCRAAIQFVSSVEVMSYCPISF